MCNGSTSPRDRKFATSRAASPNSWNSTNCAWLYAADHRVVRVKGSHQELECTDRLVRLADLHQQVTETARLLQTLKGFVQGDDAQWRQRSTWTTRTTLFDLFPYL